jgi:hypothetical protein
VVVKGKNVRWSVALADACPWCSASKMTMITKMAIITIASVMHKS